jgi:hypothetical protein
VIDVFIRPADKDVIVTVATRDVVSINAIVRFFNSLPAMDAHERPLFIELLGGLVTLLIFVRC